MSGSRAKNGVGRFERAKKSEKLMSDDINGSEPGHASMSSQSGRSYPPFRLITMWIMYCPASQAADGKRFSS
jgi:hypothetical protein